MPNVFYLVTITFAFPSFVNCQRSVEHRGYSTPVAPLMQTTPAQIVGGQLAILGEFPHMAAVGFQPSHGEDVLWRCGGTILNDKFVLTAAHCLNHSSHGEAKWVRLGNTDLDTTNYVQKIRVSEGIPHPEYNSSFSYHDIGLLRLETAANLNTYVRPACLYVKREIKDKKAIATGWGKTSWNGPRSNTLQKVTLDLYDQAYCGLSYKNHIGSKLARGIDDEIQICAGFASEEVKDTCEGDSGGPLQIYHNEESECFYYIIGITSFGRECSGSPGAYTRVSSYVNWIEKTIGFSWHELCDKAVLGYCHTYL